MQVNKVYINNEVTASKRKALQRRTARAGFMERALSVLMVARCATRSCSSSGSSTCPPPHS